MASAPLADALRYPLLAAIRDRRSRRVPRGTSIAAGPLSWRSASEPCPLTPLEEAVLIVATGLTGITAHDGPLDMPDGGKELGTPFVNLLARSASSPDNSQTTHFVMANDEGTWLIRHLSGREGLALMRDLPPRWEEWSEADWLAAAREVKHRLFDRRLDFPREYPYYFAWNKQTSNRPGTTMFLPLVDTTRMYINGVLNILAEPDRQRPLFIDDWQRFRPRTLMDWMAWAGGKVGLAPKIPYQPIGGARRARDPFVNADHVLPLGLARMMFADHEPNFLLQNLALVAQALGLGAWIHVGPQAPYLFLRDEAKGVFGLQFRMHTPARTWRRWPPLPSTQPHPVGIDGVLEGLCPPYVRSMAEAVDRLIAEKYERVYESELFARAYRDPALAKTYVQAAPRYTPAMIDYAKEICTYVWETYGRFPAHCDAIHNLGTWLQVCHVELGYYERYFAPATFRRQAEHAGVWGH